MTLVAILLAVLFVTAESFGIIATMIAAITPTVALRATADVSVTAGRPVSVDSTSGQR